MAVMQAGQTTDVQILTKGASKTLKFDKGALVRSGSASGGKYFKYYESANNGKKENTLTLSKAEYDALKDLDADGNGVINRKDYDILKSKNSKYIDYDSCEGLHMSIPIGNKNSGSTFDVIF